MLALPLLYNLQVKIAVANLTLGDKAAAVEPLKPEETLAVLRRSGSSQKCFNACIDLLLTGQITAYVAADLPRGGTEPASEIKATMHRLVRVNSCENRLVIPKNRSYNEKHSGTVAYSLKAAAEQGTCIQSTEIQLADAGPLRAIVHLDRKSLDYPESSLFIATRIRPSRIAVYAKAPDQGWPKIMQQTNVSYSFLGPILAHSIAGGQISSLRSSWWRRNASSETLNVEKFLAQEMGANLRKN
jgi:hypothetical protein